MTVINLETLATVLGGSAVIDGHLLCTQWGGRGPVHRTVGEQVIAPDPITVDLVDGVPTETFDLEPTDGTFCWRILLTIPRAGYRVKRYVTVPDAGPVDWEDLIDVDPDTFTPSATATTAWLAAIAEVEALIADLESGAPLDPGVAALVPDNATATGAALAAKITAAISAARLTGQVNMLDIVGSNNGSTDHGATLTAVIAGLSAESNAQGATPTIYFPRGQWVLSGNYANSNSKRFNIVGDGPTVTTLKRPAGASGDFITLAASNTFIDGLTIEGGRYQGVTGNSLVLDGAYVRASHVYFNKSGSSAVVIGKGGTGIAHVLNNLMFRENAGYGIWTVAGSGCTDGMWSNIDIGNTGLYGVRLGTGSQNVSNLHVWGSGLESATERDGIFCESGGNQFSNWQSEKNLGRGVRIESNNNLFTGGRAWANTLGGVYILSGLYNSIVGNTFHQNSVSNSAGSTSVSFAVIFIDGTSSRNTIANNTFWDNANVLDGNTYVTAPTYPYTGRTNGLFSHALLIAENGTANNNVIVGNDAPRELTRLNSTTPPYVIIGNNDTIANNDWGVIPLPTRSISSGAVRIPAESDTIIVSASAEITSVLGGRAGRVARIIFTNGSPSAVRDNGTTLNLNGDFTPTTNDVLSLVSDGTNWYEIARSTN